MTHLADLAAILADGATKDAGAGRTEGNALVSQSVLNSLSAYSVYTPQRVVRDRADSGSSQTVLPPALSKQASRVSNALWQCLIACSADADRVSRALKLIVEEGSGPYPRWEHTRA